MEKVMCSYCELDATAVVDIGDEYTHTYVACCEQHRRELLGEEPLS
jgi:hypothetical protein